MNDLNQLLNNPPQGAPAQPQAAPAQPQAAPVQQYAPQAAPPQYAPQPQAAPVQQQQYAPQPQAAPVQQQYAPQPQAAPVGQPQASQGPAPLQGGMSQYANASAGLFNEVGSEQRTYFDCEGTWVVELSRLKLGRSTNPNKNNGRPFFGANFKILRTDVCKVDPTHTAVKDGVEISWMTWLPRDPNYMTVEDKYNLADALTLGSSIIGLKQQDPTGNPYINFGILDQMCQDDGAIAKGKIFGVQVVGKPGKGKDGTQVIYYNARFFPVDAQWQRFDGYTPEQIQAMNAG